MSRFAEGESPAPVLHRRRIRVLIDMELRVHDITPEAVEARRANVRQRGFTPGPGWGPPQEHQRALLHALLQHPDVLRTVLHRQATDEIADGMFAEEIRVLLNDLTALDSIIGTLAPDAAAFFRSAQRSGDETEYLEDYFDVFAATLLKTAIIDISD